MKHAFQENIRRLIASAESHRSDINRYNSEIAQGWTVMEKAEEYWNSVYAMEESFVAYSDDPEAIMRLSDKLERMTEIQEFMKDANKCVQEQDKNSFLLLKFGTDDLWQEINKPDYFKRRGFPRYLLITNNANIRRVQRRLRILNEDTGRVTNETTVHGVRVIENVETNRIQLIFKAAPATEVREKLLRFFHFRWGEQAGAWERFLSRQGVYETAAFLIWYGNTEEPKPDPPPAPIDTAASTEIPTASANPIQIAAA